MKLYHFHNPHDFRYAQAARRGTWFPDPGPGLCPECTSSRQERIPPLILKWLPGSDLIGDFVWPGFDDEVVVSQRVRDAFENRFRGFEFKPVEMWQEPKLKRPQRITKRTKPRVWLPYEGPPLWDLWVTAYAHLDLEKSGWSIDRVCSTCGRVFYTTPPYEERYLVIDIATWGGEEIFRLHESGWVFCTQGVKDFVEEAGFTNVGFLEDGVIPM